ncbi:AI-2E family transporter [Sphingosinicella sp. CPCC 101087]|uniref:AI-2E family transporter n=1 Tax=Sphingosinicella sp. CPCC 101087 TaxID=2497754 RepID=UPI00197E422A|nr:AI-2E family transporter [Sphingosinicella sp. CPCC 101087]
MSGEPISHRVFIERLVIAIIVIGIALLLWNLRDLFLLMFGAILVSVILNLVAAPIRSRLKLPHWAALLAAILIVAGVILGAFWTFGAEVTRQATGLREMVPAAWQAALDRFDAWGIGEMMREWSASLSENGGVLSNLGAIAMSVGNALADTFLVLVAGIYLAAQPGLYWTGMIKLVPERGRALAAQAMEASARALRLWLLGRMVSMAAVGILTWLGLTLIGVPSALTLGLLAALLEFVPFIGPIIAAVPAVLLAFAAGPDEAFWTMLLFLLVQQFEGNVLEPIVQQRAVDLPPALLLFALVAGGFIFGVSGIILAAPLTVVLYVLVKRLYVQEALHTRTRMPGDD